MKKLFLVLFIVCLGTSVHAFIFPTVEQVATKLYANYSIPELQSGERLQYQKKKDGWHVAYMVYSEKEDKYLVEKEQLYWSAAIGKYKSITLFESGQTAFTSYRRSQELRNVYDFGRCPYYGYDGWDQDIISDFANYNGTNDTIYEALARAYSNFAHGYATRRFSFHVPLPENMTEKERIDLFIENEKKAIAVYDALRKRSPAFEVLVGGVNTKYCNEIMAAYDDLMYYGREAEMNPYFEQDLYDPFMLAIARSMLESCAPNGILFTNGDTDSYPLWYLQWIKGVRTDVAVMNTSLMNTGFYLSRFRKGFLKVPAVKMGIPESMYNMETYFGRGEAGAKREVKAEEFGEQVYQLKAGDDKNFYKPCMVVLHHMDRSTEYDFLSSEDSAVIKLDYSYYTQGQMAILDVLFSNFGQRPIYAAVSIALPAGIEEHFFLEGMVRRFIPAREKINNSEMSWMGPVASTSILKNNMMKLLASDSTSSDRVNRDRWVLNVKLSAIYAADMIVGTDQQAAVALLNALYAFCPYAGGKLKAMDVYSLDIYYKAGDPKAGDALGTALLDHLEKELGELEQKQPLDTDDQSLRMRDQSALKTAKETFDRHQRAALSARTQKLKDRF